MPASNKPTCVMDLEKCFGAPSQNAFGSAVFFAPTADQQVALIEFARSNYRHFLGELVTRSGEQRWMDSWKEVYLRTCDASRDIVAELRQLPDRGARMSAGLLLENQENSEASMKALQNVFDHPDMQELRVFTIGDGEAMSGIILASQSSSIGSVCLVLLMD